MINVKNSLILGFIVLSLAACGESMEREPLGTEVLADFSALNEGWNRLQAGGETVCSDGSPYEFFVRPGDPEKLMFYLEGGGACWMGSNCDPQGQPSYQINLAATDPSRAHGVLAFDQQDNPFVDYTVVYAPYCSGDVHLGETRQTYEAPGQDDPLREIDIHHFGWLNGQSALSWTQRHVFAPRQIFVTGSSAGSIPSPFYAVKLAEAYRSARIVQLGDGSGGYRGFANFNPYDAWNTDRVIDELPYMRSISADDFSFHQLYIAAAEHSPAITLASFDTAEDNVQKQFLAMGGTPASFLQPLLEANLNEISRQVPDFRYFVAGGEMHTILLRPQLYTYAVNGTRFVDWLAGLAAGSPVQNQFCADCTEPELR